MNKLERISIVLGSLLAVGACETAPKPILQERTAVIERMPDLTGFYNAGTLYIPIPNSDKIIGATYFFHPDNLSGAPDFEAYNLVCPLYGLDERFAIKDNNTGLVWLDLDFNEIADKPPEILTNFNPTEYKLICGLPL